MHLHFWPAGYPLICPTCCCLACGGPDEGGVGAVGVIPVGVAPGVDEVVWGYVGINHGRFGFEVAFGGRCSTQIGRSNQIGEENCCACGGCDSGGAGIRANWVSTVIGKITIAGRLKCSDLGLGGGGGTVTANSACGTESETCEDSDNGDDSEKFDEGEGGPASLSPGKPC